MLCEYISLSLVLLRLALAEKLPITPGGFGRCAGSGCSTNMALLVAVQTVASLPVTPGCSKLGLVISVLVVCSLPAVYWLSGSCVPLLALAICAATVDKTAIETAASARLLRCMQTLRKCKKLLRPSEPNVPCPTRNRQ